MSEENPYQAPAANVEQTQQANEIAANSVPAGNGASWYGEGWNFFKADPWIWIGLVVVYFVVFLIMAIIPILNNFLPTLLTPVFTAGIMLGCRAIDNGERLDIGYLFAGFKNRTGELIGLGAISLVVYIVIFGVAFGAMIGMGAMDSMFEMDAAAGADPNQMMSTMVLPILIALLFIIPAAMFFWFAPAILVFNENIGIIDAMKLSFMGCIKNIIPLIIYGLVGAVLSVIAAIPIFLGFLIFVPVYLATIYVSYKDIFES